MNRQISIWKCIQKSIETNIPVMLLYVLESVGSSPGRQGFFMAINAHHEMEGSIGGGIMEHKFVEMSKDRLRVAGDGLRVAEVRKQMHDKTTGKNQSGMICSGEQTILVYQVQEKDLLPIGKIIASLEENKNGTLQLSPGGMGFEQTAPAKDFEFNLKNDDQWKYIEKTGYKKHLYIIGGGHCALAFSKLMSGMDFYIHLFEDRAELNTVEANNYVHEKKLVNDYSELTELIPSGENNYVVVMTFGYRTDDVAVRALLEKQFIYFGLLGSTKKIEKMFDDYRKEGMNAAALNKIHSPIGLQIKSETPEEIAVSIAAEIIKVKNER